MATSVEQKLSFIIGQAQIRIAVLETEIEELKEKPKSNVESPNTVATHKRRVRSVVP
jgi:FtsZ-binding cell division protein ZapB